MNIMKYKNVYLLFSLIVLVPGIISLFIYRLNLSNDFTGGSVFSFDLGKSAHGEKESAAALFKGQGIRVREITFDSIQNITLQTDPATAKQNDAIKNAVVSKYPQAKQTLFETIGPSIGLETTKKSVTALGVASIGIVLYIAYAFRNIPKPYSSFKFGVSAVIAMLHDGLLVLGVFSIFRIQVDALFITALLTVIGFSVHDSIVVFDRVRENLGKLPKSMSFENIVNYSVVETLNRSLATSFTVIAVLTSLLLLGGGSTRNFVLALTVGMISGTYSSIFTASPILVIWEDFRARTK